ncbi:MAG: hypothetical protein ACC651_12950 [Candidatus Scalindua sp.]
MPILNWRGKKQVINHDKEVPFRLLKRVESLSVGKSENLIIKGDNLEALKALIGNTWGGLHKKYKFMMVMNKDIESKLSEIRGL